MTPMQPVRRDYWMVPVDMIVVDDDTNYTDGDRGDIEALAQAIRHNGVDPIKCSRLEDGTFFLREGFRRMRAVRLINKQSPDTPIERVPVILAERHANETDHAIHQIVENSHREDATPLQKATAYNALIAIHGLQQEEIATRTGESLQVIRRHLLLLRAAPPIRKALEKGTIGITAAAEIIRKNKTEDEQHAAFEKALASGGGKATAQVVQSQAKRIRAPYRTTRGHKEVSAALGAIEAVIRDSTYRTNNKFEPAVWRGYLGALKWVLGGPPPWIGTQAEGGSK